MIKKINIAGIELDNYTVREAIMLVEKELDNNVFNTIEEVNMNLLLQAKSDARVREMIEKLDHTVISEYGILSAAGEKSVQRKVEIEEHHFYFELLKRLVRNRKTIFLLGRTQEEVEDAQETILTDFPKCEIVGAEAFENCVGVTDAIVNEINTVTPDVIISILPTPEQEYFLSDNKDKLSANLWYGIGSEKIAQKKHGVMSFFSKLVRLRRLENTITSYEKKEVDGNE